MYRDDVRERTYAPSTDKTSRRRDDKQERHHAHERDDFRQDKIVGAVHTHNLHRIDLFCDAHRTYLGGNITSHFTGQNQTEDCTRELEQQCITSQQTRNIGRQQRVLRICLRLNGQNRADENRDQQHNWQRL